MVKIKKPWTERTESVISMDKSHRTNTNISMKVLNRWGIFQKKNLPWLDLDFLSRVKAEPILSSQLGD
jgi:hypothetical protein